MGCLLWSVLLRYCADMFQEWCTVIGQVAHILAYFGRMGRYGVQLGTELWNGQYSLHPIRDYGRGQHNRWRSVCCYIPKTLFHDFIIRKFNHLLKFHDLLFFFLQSSMVWILKCWLKCYEYWKQARRPNCLTIIKASSFFNNATHEHFSIHLFAVPIGGIAVVCVLCATYVSSVCATKDVARIYACIRSWYFVFIYYQ